MSLHENFIRLVEFDLARRDGARGESRTPAWRVLLLNTLARALALPEWCPDAARLAGLWKLRHPRQAEASRAGRLPPAEFLAEVAAEFADWCLGSGDMPTWMHGLTDGDLAIKP